MLKIKVSYRKVKCLATQETTTAQVPFKTCNISGLGHVVHAYDDSVITKQRRTRAVQGGVEGVHTPVVG